MKACATAGGGVMYIPETVERRKNKISYAELLREEAPAEKRKPFGKRVPAKRQSRKAA